MANKDRNVILARNTIIGFITLAVIIILGFGIYVSTDLDVGTEFIANQDYRIVENPLSRRVGDPITVVEFFSYGCIHCKTFDPVVAEWAAAQPDDVAFSRQPVTFSPSWALLAQTYLTFASANVLEENHQRLFRAIHDTRRQFLTAEMMAEYVDGRGISRADFLREFNSPGVRNSMRDADRAQRRFQIASTPSLVVAGKYVIDMDGGQRRALRIADHLITQERSALAINQAKN